MSITKRAGRRAIMGVATAAVIGTTIAVAEARIPGVGNGVQQTTDAPDLRSVNIDAGDLRRVKFCFDQPLNATPSSTGFLIQTYDSKRFIQSTSASIAPDNQSCVLAIMGSGADLAQGTIGSVQGDAVTDAAARRNVPSSEPLGGSVATPAPGSTTGPDLIGAARDLASRSIVFSFDENLDGSAINPASFAFVDDKGFVTRGTSVAGQGGNAVRVVFTETAGGGTVGAAAGSFVDAGAVRDAPQSGVFVAGTPLSTPSATGAITYSDNSARTRLVSVAGDGPRQLRLTYNNPVNRSGVPAQIVAILDDGTSVPASSVEDITADSVRATFQTAGLPDVTADPTALVRVVDTGAAVITDDPDRLGSLPATVAAGTPKNAPGFTNGPDLLAAAYDRPGSRVFYVFDENLGGANSAGFFVTAPSGSRSGTSGSNTTNGGIAAVTFGTSASSSIAAGGTQGATVDPLGNPSPQSAVSYELQRGAPPTPTGPGTNQNPPPPPPPVVRRRFRTTFASFRVKSRTRYAGRIRSSGRGCLAGRRIVLKRNGRSIRRSATRGDGTFSIRRTRSTAGKKRVYVVVTQRTKGATTCSARSSKRLRRG